LTIVDTNIVIRRIRNKEPISEDITVVTLVEYPFVLDYEGFRGSILFPTTKDYYLAFEIQRRLAEKGRMKGFADLLVAAIAINNGEELVTGDEDFSDIAEVSPLKLRLVR